MKSCSSFSRADSKHYSVVPAGALLPDFNLTRQYLPGYFHAPLPGLLFF